MLSLPSSSRPTPPVSPPVPAGAQPGASVPAGAQQPPLGTESLIAIPEPTGFWSHLTPKRSKDLINRESIVAMRESEVARREAELLAGSPGGLTLSCPPAPVQTIVEAFTFTVTHTLAPVLPPPMPVETQTVVKEVVREIENLEPPPWYRPANPRFDEITDREAKVADRELQIAMREDVIGRREADATRREGWIMEQLLQVASLVYLTRSADFSCLFFSLFSGNSNTIPTSPLWMMITCTMSRPCAGR